MTFGFDRFDYNVNNNTQPYDAAEVSQMSRIFLAHRLSHPQFSPLTEAVVVSMLKESLQIVGA